MNLQMFAVETKGVVYPVHKNKFKISKTGPSGTADTIIRGLTNFSPTIEGNVETWYAMDEEGWQSALVTGKALSISFSGKRQVGDAGNDYIAGMFLTTGTNALTKFCWDMTSGAKLEFEAVVNVTKAGGGDTTGVDELEFEVICNGKPTFTPTPSSS